MPFDATLLEPAGFDEKLLEPFEEQPAVSDTLTPQQRIALQDEQPFPSIVPPKPFTELAIAGGPRVPVASLAETLAEPIALAETMSEGLMTPAITLPRMEPVSVRPPSIPERSLATVAGLGPAAVFGPNVPVSLGRGAVNLAIGIPEFMTSPVGSATAILGAGAALAGKAGQIVNRLLAAGFSADMVKSLYQQGRDTIQNWGNMTPDERAVAVENMAGTAGMAGMLGLHAARGGRAPAVPERKPPVIPEPAKPPPIPEQPVEAAPAVPVEAGRERVEAAPVAERSVWDVLAEKGYTYDEIKAMLPETRERLAKAAPEPVVEKALTNPAAGETVAGVKTTYEEAPETTERTGVPALDRGQSELRGKALQKRLREAQGLLSPQAKRSFGKSQLDLENRRLISEDGTWSLQYFAPGETIPGGDIAASKGSVVITDLKRQHPAAPAAQPEGVADASSIETTAEVHGDVRTQPRKGKGKVPVEEGGKGVQPQAPEGLPRPEKPEVLLTEPAAKPAAAKEPWEIGIDDYVAERMEQVRSSSMWRNAPQKFRQTLEQSEPKKFSAEWYDLNEKAFAEGKQTQWIPPWALTAKQVAERSGDTLDSYIKDAHRKTVQEALSTGKPVPAEVLADYPDLAEQAPSGVTPPVEKLLPKPKKYDYSDRDKVPGEHYQAKPNSIVIQFRGLDTMPLMAEKPFELKFNGDLSKAGKDIMQALRQAREQGLDFSYRESVIIATDSNGNAIYHFNVNPAEGTVSVTSHAQLLEARKQYNQMTGAEKPLAEKPAIAAPPPAEPARPATTKGASQPAVPETKAPSTVTAPISEPAAGEPISPGPGAAAVGTPGTDTAIKQLNDYIAALPPLPAPRKLTLAERWADAKAEAGDVVGRLNLRGRAVTETLKDMWRGVRKPTELGDKIGELDYVLQRSSAESREASRTMQQQIKNPDVRAGMWIFADAQGDLTSIRDTLNNLPPDTKPSVRRALEHALNLPPQAKDWLPFIEQFYGIRAQEGISEGILRGALEDYYTHVWKTKDNMPASLQAALNKGRVSEYFQFSRERHLSTILEGIRNPMLASGKRLEPVLDPARIIPVYNYALDRAIASRHFMKALSDMTASDGRPLVAPSGTGIPTTATEYVVKKTATGTSLRVFENRADADAYAASSPGSHVEERQNEFLLIKSKVRPEDLDGYRSIDHPSMRQWKWASTDAEGKTILYEGELLAHPEAYERLARILDRSRLTPSGVTRAALRYGGEIKAAKLGLLSTFHMVHVGKHALFHWTNPFQFKPIDWSSPNTRFAIEQGHLKLAPEPGEIANFSEGIMSPGLVHQIPGIGPLSKTYSEWLFMDYIPRLKMATFEGVYNRLNAVYGPGRSTAGKVAAFGAPELTPKEVAARAGDVVNSAYGELNKLWLGKWGRDPRFQRALRMMFLAPDFGEARLRFVGKAATQYGWEERLALVTNFAAVYLAARAANWMASGDARAEDPKHWFDVRVGNKWYSMRSVMTDLMHAYSDMSSFVRVRLNPGIVEPLLEGLTHSDWRGRKRNTGEMVVDMLEKVAPIQMQGLTSPDRTILDGFLASMGIAPKKGDPVSETFELAKLWKEKSTDPRVQADLARREHEVLPPSAYKNLRFALDQGKTGDAWMEYQNLLKSRTAKQIDQTMHAERPFTGSKAWDNQFVRTLTPAEKTLYDQAKEQRRNQYRVFRQMLASEGRSAKAESPETAPAVGPIF